MTKKIQKKQSDRMRTVRAQYFLTKIISKQFLHRAARVSNILIASTIYIHVYIDICIVLFLLLFLVQTKFEF